MDEHALEARIVDQLRTLRAGTTMCPGKLSVNLGFRLPQLRATLLTMAREGRLAILQRGRVIPPGEELKGPFRVAPSAGLGESISLRSERV